MSARTPQTRRRVLRSLAVTALAVPSLLMAAGAAQADTTAAKSYSPVGTWSAQVTTSIPSSGTTGFTFLADGTMGNDTDTWYCTGRTTFSYDIKHPHKDSSGNVDGSVVGHQDAVLSDKDHWTSHGVSNVLDLQGNVVSSFTVDVVATRTS
ncbi:putative secreted protein [Streptomyces davaonensis JCM 4913]|uniref:Putative secreted protein n=1 Tax=Streptomyces davaonensis (strain DSM 101723 / JCM 4913 / KCC S-0913 / 768) TaxID=1214101 RepID=K4R187_STRDJ|nr:hypothetical protein [Streptomyces davaonensis]CCK26887.1 putative secreted protein [Streptomyces davaonensis JCM 4913]